LLSGAFPVRRIVIPARKIVILARRERFWRGRKKRGAAGGKMTAPRFGLKEVGSLFYIQLPLGPFF
ncbi:MAG: hypothetical protein ABUT39_19245, partial [Acidobacteriota bacterium]